MTMTSACIRISTADSLSDNGIVTPLYHIDPQGPIRHIETEHNHLFVFGYFGHDMEPFLDPANHSQLDRDLTDSNFYLRLTGHFCLLVAGKSIPAMRLIASRYGGKRLYIRNGDSGELLLSDSLAALSESHSRLEKTVVQEILQFRWTTSDNSLLAGIAQLPPAHYRDLTLDATGPARCYETYWRPSPVADESLENCTTNTEQTLTRVIHASLKPGARVAVLLSGGVDSSLLAALAQKSAGNLVAISHHSPAHANPELETAKRFASALGMEHRIITVDDSDIPDAFIRTVEIVEQPPRNQSSLILYHLFKSMDGEFDQILYGEAADVLFGSGMIKRYAARLDKQRRLHDATRWLPFFGTLLRRAAPRSKLARLYDESVFQFMAQANILDLQPAAQALVDQHYDTVLPLATLAGRPQPGPQPARDEALCLLKSHVVSNYNVNHFHETCSLASHFGMEMVSPFVHPDILDLAATLNGSNYFGEDYVKPVLRKIGEQYFPPELMYLPKRGFPAPYVAWMHGVLQPLWEETRQYFKLDSRFNDDVEFMWTMSAFLVLVRHLNLDNPGLFPSH